MSTEKQLSQSMGPVEGQKNQSGSLSPRFSPNTLSMSMGLSHSHTDDTLAVERSRSFHNSSSETRRPPGKAYVVFLTLPSLQCVRIVCSCLRL